MIRRLFQRKKPSILSPLFLHFLNSSLDVIPRDEKWYVEAITHRSKKSFDQQGKDNERLEFLGDAFISLVVAHYLLLKFPNKSEGELTQLRAKMVSRNNLNKIAEKLQLENHIDYQKSKNTYKSLLGNCLEALFGAILLDQGFEKAKSTFIEKVLNSVVDINQVIIENRDYKSELLMTFQKKNQKLEFKVEKISADDHKIKFLARVFSEGVELGDGIVKYDDAIYGKNGTDRTQLIVTLHSGKNRVIRRTMEFFEKELLYLDRIEFAGIKKRELQRGKWRFLDQKELGFLKMVKMK